MCSLNISRKGITRLGDQYYNLSALASTKWLDGRRVHLEELTGRSLGHTLNRSMGGQNGLMMEGVNNARQAFLWAIGFSTLCGGVGGGKLALQQEDDNRPP